MQMTELKAEVLDAIKAIDEMTEWHVVPIPAVKILRDLLFRQNAQIEALVKELEWYADKKNYCINDVACTPVIHEQGAKARAALKSIKE